MKYILSFLLIFSSFSSMACQHKECDHDSHTKKSKATKILNYGPDITKDHVTFSGAWVRSSASRAKNTAAYLKITNDGDHDISLKEVVVNEVVADRAEIHGYKTDSGDVKKMFKLESVTVPAKTTVEFAPGSYHLMLLGLKQKIEKKSVVDITLRYSYVKPQELNSEPVSQEVSLKFMAN